MKKKHILLIILSIIILIILVYFILNQERKLTIIETIIKEPILYVQKIAIKPINILKENNTINRNKLNNYNLLENELEEKDKQIEELENLLEIKTNFSNYKITNASVINRSIGLWYQTLTIDKGTDDGIELNEAVVDNNGLIGKIIKTTKHTSTVKLLTSLNQSFKLAVLIKNEEDDVFGVLSEYKNNKFIIRGISYNKEIKKDSIVITSGLDNNFPSGLLIGKVSSVEKDNFDLEQIVSVDSVSKFDNINYVAVLKRLE